MSHPLGIFRAVATRDGQARARDGQAYFAMNKLDESGSGDAAALMRQGGELYEIQFGDGEWLLVRAADLVTGTVPHAGMTD